jgi:hypothetical protein
MNSPLAGEGLGVRGQQIQMKITLTRPSGTLSHRGRGPNAAPPPPRLGHSPFRILPRVSHSPPLRVFFSSIPV